MPSLFDIGKSGLQAYRQSLAVTGQNIANINTEGYKKRATSLQEVSGAGGGVTEISDQTGLGVRVNEIRRAFDEFLLDKTRQTSALFEKSDTFLDEVKDLENLLLPSDSNLSKSVGEFFNSLQEIAAAPDDQAPRIIAVEKGKDLAGQFNLYSDRINNLKNKIIEKSNDSVTSVNLLTDQISKINTKLLASGVSGTGSNALFDQRDLLIDQLAQISQISVKYGSKGEAEIRLGNSGSGPIIVNTDSKTATSTNNTVPIDVLVQGSRLQPVVGINNVATNQIQGGKIAGLVDSYALADDTLQEIDNLAILLSKKFNEINMNGINLDGEKGKQMFSISSLEAIENPTNRSSVGVAVFVTDPDKIQSNTNFNVIYDGKENVWNLSSEFLKNSINGKDSIEAPGFKISFFGKALDGDEFDIIPTSASKGMNFLFSRPQDFAAASSTLISSSSSNLGSAELSEIALIKEEDKTTLLNLNNVFSNGLNPVTSTEISADGGVTIIPAGTSSFNFSSYQSQPEIKFGLSSSDITNLTNLSLTLSDGTSLSIDLTGVSTIEEVSDVLNRSRDVNGNSHNFRTKGLFASAGGTTLTIASNNLTFSSGSLTAGGTINGVITNPAITSASQIQVMTREGRHIAGTVLSSSEIAQFMTVENGFSKHAEYRADYLNGKDENSYRNINVTRSTVDGNHEIIINSAGGTTLSAQRAASTIPSSHVSAAYTLGMTSLSAGSVNITVPVESSAANTAQLINTNANNLGIHASAVTRIKIPAPSSDGTISFSLKSKSGLNNTVSITSSVVTTDMTNLATAVNNFSGRTGVVAYLSSDKKSVIMENPDGDDIEFSSFTSPSALTVKLLKSDFSESGQSVVLDSTSFRAAKFSGELKLDSSSSFTTTNDGGSTTVSSIQNGFNDGFYNITSSATGEVKTISPIFLTGDLSSSHPDGLSASSSILSYGIKLPATGTGSDFTTTQDLSMSENLSQFDVSKKLVEGLRENSPSVEISGISINSLPPDGSSFKMNHDNLTYTFTMKNGEINVSGAEKDKVTAYFENPEALTIDTTALSGSNTITLTEHDLETGDAVTYNAAERVVVDTSNFVSTTTITATAHGFSTGDPVVYKAGTSTPISGLVDGTTYFAIAVDSDNFKLATSTSNASSNTALTITGGTGGSAADVFSSPRAGLVDGQTYFAVKTDDHNFQLAETYTLATNSTPSVITIGTGGLGGNSSDSFDPGKSLYISAGKTISASQFSFPSDTANDSNALAFGMSAANVETTITGKSITTPTASDTTHFHIRLEDNSNVLGVFVRSNSKTIDTSSISSSSSTLTSNGHGFKTGDKILYTANSSNLNGLTSGTSYFVKVIDANTFSLSSTFDNATSDNPILLSFGGSGGNASDTFATVFAEVYVNDDIASPTTASSIGITAEINQISDTNAQISIIKEADKKTISIDSDSFSDGTTAETNFGFYTNQTHVNVVDDSIRIQSFGTDITASTPVNIEIPSNSMKSLVGNNLSVNNVPNEDLVILVTGSGTRKLASSYGEIISSNISPELKVKVDATNSSKIEILDADTNHTIATRLIPSDGIVTAANKSLRFVGDTNINDEFTILNNFEGIGDNRNILEMISLQEADLNGPNTGSFQDIFNSTVAEIGSTVRSGQLSLQDAEATRDEAKAAEDERAGVSLDEEASALIQFQQAFSANARIIQTARELFDSLMMVVSK